MFGAALRLLNQHVRAHALAAPAMTMGENGEGDLEQAESDRLAAASTPTAGRRR